MPVHRVLAQDKPPGDVGVAGSLRDELVGVFPGGFALFAAINAITGGDSHKATLPSPWQQLAVVLATVLVVAALTTVPARLGGRRPVTETLQAELAYSKQACQSLAQPVGDEGVDADVVLGPVEHRRESRSPGCARSAGSRRRG